MKKREVNDHPLPDSRLLICNRAKSGRGRVKEEALTLSKTEVLTGWEF